MPASTAWSAHRHAQRRYEKTCYIVAADRVQALLATVVGRPGEAVGPGRRQAPRSTRQLHLSAAVTAAACRT